MEWVFFSILYWLIGHPHRKLIIFSTYKENDTYCKYLATIREVNDNLVLEMNDNPDLDSITILNTSNTGTVITIDATNDPFTLDQYNMFIRYINRLQEIDDVSIYVEDKTYINNRLSFDNRLIIKINPNIIEVKDNATGIPLSVLFGSLLVPSISTKTIVSSHKSNVPFNDKTQIVYSYNLESTNSFNICVGDIAVVNILDVEPSSLNIIFNISLPLNTPLPVSRDDIIINDITKNMLLTRIKKLIDDIISDTYYITNASVHRATEFLIESNKERLLNKLFYFLESYYGIFYQLCKDILDIIIRIKYWR